MPQRKQITSPPNEWRNIPFHLIFLKWMENLVYGTAKNTKI